MTIHQIQFHFNKQHLVRISQVGLLLLSIMLATPASAQITVGGNVYGGGNKGAMTNAGNATEAIANVTIKAGSITGKVFGGARQAAIAGGTHVILDGEKASANIIIGEVYGGNDVAGTVSGTATVETTYRADDANDATKNARIYVTNLYGGGNGDYDYTSDQVQKKDINGNVVVDDENKPVMEANEFKDLTSPNIANTVINITSGCYNQVFAGGNSATVTTSASITLNNSTTNLLDATGHTLGYQFDRVFGGNNKVAMAIRPTWTLTKAIINNLYSGGNAGDMTHPNGILLAVTGSGMTINNVYGGCRMANVNPAQNKITSETIEGVAFPSGYAARTLIKGGKINNVYGGNDISGNVYGGCALEIQSSILNDVYGGGNGSYAYANKEEWQTDNPTESDLFYTGNLYDHRPNAESVYLHVIGTEAAPTYIGGSLYCGGNSATLTGTSDNSAQLQIGSYVIADKVFLGSNGENMVTSDMLAAMNERNTFKLTTSADFEEYMRGVEVNIKPTVAFDKDYKEYSTKFGSIYCGGNVGSMSAAGQFTINFLNSLVIYDKIVGGCNNANVAKTTNNAFHRGGLTTAMTTDDPKVLLNISGVKLEPRYLDKTTTPYSLKWNQDAVITDALKGANVYGGCYESGYVNGKVQINVTADAISENVFSTTGDDQSGANYETMRDNPLVSTMSVYGGGYGKETEIWGDVAVNVTNNAHILKVYGGGELGYVGKMTRDAGGVMQKTVAKAYGTNVTLNATAPTGTDFAALNAAKIYGGGFKGDVTGKTHVDLGQGRVYNAFGGACNADIFGGAEIYVGQTSVPEVTNNIYAANDFGGQITGSLAHNAQYDAARYQTVRSNAYLEYYDAKITGDVFGGPCGSYDYTTTYACKFTSLPTLLTTVTKNASDAFAANTFVNILANNYTNKVANVFGGGQGLKGSMGNADVNSSYVLLHSQGSSQLADNIYGAGDCSLTKNSLVDAYTGLFGTIFGGCHGVSLAEDAHSKNVATLTYMGDNSEVAVWDGMTNKQMDVYGAGAYSGTKESKVTLNGGSVKDVYGASYNQGVTYMATVDVPSTSTAHVNAIFGGGRGENPLYPCDTFNSFINYNSANSSVEDAIYGGNFAYRLTRSSYVNINVPVKNAEGDLLDVYGAGYGESTVAQYTKVNLNTGSSVKNVYGGGRNGMVCDMPSLDKYMEVDYFGQDPSATDAYQFGYAIKDKEITDYNGWFETKGSNVNGETIYGLIAEPEPAIRNTLVLIKEGALVTVDAYGGGLGRSATVSGATGLDLLGGTVTEDIYGGGYGGNVAHYNDVANHPSTNVHIQGGTVRNVYGGGYEGHVVGTANTTLGTINQETPTFYNGLPTVERSLYGGGEMGHVEGTANLTINNGYVGYKYDGANFVENLKIKDSDTKTLLVENGNAFGGGYGEGAYVVNTVVTLNDGTIRNSLYGGGEIASIGVADESSINTQNRASIPHITEAGSTEVNMYGGLVSANVFGGGRGYAIAANGNTETGKIGYSDGYVFGKTCVNIYRGTIGTDATLEDGNGNVFGGGNIGYVYGADNSLATTYKNVTKSDDGYYHITGTGGSGHMSEDCKVVITPACKAIADGTVNSVEYHKGDIVNCSVLDNYTKAVWDSDGRKTVFGNLDKQGVIIRNAVFAGGNVSAGSDKVYANTKTVYGNATASVIDCLTKDLITIGDDDIGGLYGDGNLTFVDGYRELNIKNYGTDYYSLNSELSYDDYKKLNDRERAYFELKYKCNSTYTIGGKTYNAGSYITGTEYESLDDADKESKWTPSGFCTLYAGRMMNTIQRADFCGVWGSRMVLKGAQDRVPSVVDYTKYTINRIGELSLNQVRTSDTETNGNYFGIYNVVNYLGALTSDVAFRSTRYSDSESYPGYDAVKNPTVSNVTYYSWKENNITSRQRNNGTSKNQVALASGVWLEVVKQKAEKTTDTDVYGNYSYNVGDKIYGPITGVIEINLINASTGEGGGYVYALNEHGTLTKDNAGSQTTLAESNNGAISYKQFEYGAMSSSTVMETSGDFVNSTKQIIDDCYPNNGNVASPTHYWFIRGQYYVYDEYISAYTGSAQSYAESMTVPLTITAEANGQVTLKNVQQNLNANWTADMYNTLAKLDSKYIVDGDNSRIVINGNTYYKNTPISYWDWAHLNSTEQSYFTTNTYVCNIAVGAYTKGQVLTASEYKDATTALKGKYLVESDFTVTSNGTTKQYTKGDLIDAIPTGHDDDCRLAIECFNVTNAVTADNGFLLTYDWNNPTVWNDYYISPSSHTASDMSQTKGDNYILGPTYHCTLTDNLDKKVLGQTEYAAGDLIDASTFALQTSDITNNATATQATFEAAYVAKDACQIKVNETEYNYVKGSAISTTFYGRLTDEQKANFELGYICTQTYQVSDDKYYISGDIINATEYATVPAANQTSNFSTVYICTQDGNWGGKLYENGKNYEALDYCSLDSLERKNFQYNLDGFETLIANSTTQSATDVANYTTSKTYQGIDNYGSRHTGLYAADTPIDYTAVYEGYTDKDNKAVTSFTTSGGKEIKKGDELSRTEYESLVNEKAHYSILNVNETDVADYYYVVTTEFWVGDTWYNAGKTVDQTIYDSNTDNVMSINGSELRKYLSENNGYDHDKAVLYFCKEAYTPSSESTVTYNGTTYPNGSNTQVPLGAILTSANYDALINDQLHFDIQGTVPTETSTLYVAKSTDIDDLSQDKIVTVIYEYSYVESSEDGTSYETVKERHIVNAHIHFESGVPVVGELLDPPAVLPGNAVGLNQPSVQKGAYEILGGGWEIYSNDRDAETHKNGTEYTNNNTKMYWYQNGYQVAYYAKSYLGKTYSNSVPIIVANYHDIDDVMADTKHHMYIDNDGVQRAPKIYIDNRDCKSDATKNELDLLKDLFDATVAKAQGFNESGQITGCQNLDFILRSDIAPKKNKDNWTSIGDATNCFGGNFHGQGFTISGLDKSLFGNFCGNIYNIGVTGTFTTAGVADTGKGYVENAWISTTGTPDGKVQAVFGAPSRNDASVQLKNCYYPNTKTYKTDNTAHGVAKAMPEKSFYNGEVTYDLNGFYLNKRYSDAALTSGKDYKYYTVNADDNTKLDVHTGYYTTMEYQYPEVQSGDNNMNYVERYCADGDFIYAKGVIPTADNERLNVDGNYYPIYPDDYIFFGQMLTYGYVDGENYTYQPLPSYINKQDRLRLRTTDLSNRVFRAPAYFMSKTMDKAYFNYKAVFADKTATGSKEAYPNMTAIDFTGHNDMAAASGWQAAVSGTNAECFYPPFLDYDGLKDYQSKGLTQNMLVYAGTTDADSYRVLGDYLYEPAITQGDYGTVAKVETSNVHGHLVDYNGSTYVASRNHLLVDKQNFNAPISYTFANGQYMWYQRTPELFADGVKGWETICLPFTADLVATHQKGEITHFYGASKDNAIGHEYWLRGLNEVTTATNNGESVTTAKFIRPMSDNSRYEVVSNEVNNSFLWDYYYSKNNRDDKNSDDYQQYWNSTRTYTGYPLYTAKVPYLISFPGENFYEYDMSGKFVAQNTYQAIAQLDKQTVSFVSKANQVIAVSDGEDRTTVANNYTYKGYYQTDALSAGSYVLNATGAQFDTTTDKVAVPFRAYFMPKPSGAKSILIGEDASYIDSPESALADGTIQTYGQHRMLHIISHLDSDIMLPVYTMQGQLVQMVDLKAGAHEQLSLAGGIYIVHGQKVVVTK